ncbi:MAG TPA: four helix bundle protein [Devosia sp.]|jgi:four helix bundle protein|uniref:four helix bundle protein n=1 Tax=Devosia sp. TaxID=1871048 RepID=UPI002DDCB03A|nr:four helix bundle protein [Devosia sp.]HEV2518234.1 four helix bundle protein [Devosia sp.]
MTIESYRDLRVWQEAMDLAEACYRLTTGFPREEVYGLTSQIRRAGASIPANIAEGYGRNSKGSYVQFLRVAQGSLKELETHILLAGRLGMIETQSAEPVLASCDAVGRMLLGLLRQLERND